MWNFFYRANSAMARFMYGRNGRDQLNAALLVVYLVMLLLGFICGDTAAGICDNLSLLVAAIIFFRMFSRNLEKRRAENEKFLNWWSPIKRSVSCRRQRRMDKDHKYFTCKDCKTICRVPAGKGKIEITCPRCGRKSIGKS